MAASKKWETRSRPGVTNFWSWVYMSEASCRIVKIVVAFLPFPFLTSYIHPITVKKLNLLGLSTWSILRKLYLSSLVQASSDSPFEDDIHASTFYRTTLSIGPTRFYTSFTLVRGILWSLIEFVKFSHKSSNNKVSIVVLT